MTGWKSELTALLTENNFLANDEDLEFPHTDTKTPMDERNNTFIDEYEGGQKSVWISPWLYEVMNGKFYNFKDNPFKGIKDPRTNYYYYNQCTASGDAILFLNANYKSMSCGQLDQLKTSFGLLE